jgi:predicted xylose isomerase-like sugar epimerase
MQDTGLRLVLDTFGHRRETEFRPKEIAPCVRISGSRSVVSCRKRCTLDIATNRVVVHSQGQGGDRATAAGQTP